MFVVESHLRGLAKQKKANFFNKAATPYLRCGGFFGYIHAVGVVNDLASYK